MKSLCSFGTHRVLEPANALPQSAWKVDNSLPLQENELLVEVDTLNIDSASFHQMMEASNHQIEDLKKCILKTVEDRGKQHNPVTGSGGMLLGTILEVGSKFPNPHGFKPKDRVASLVSLSLTPLQIDEIIEVYPNRDQVKIKGRAIFFPTGILAKIPSDMNETLALAVLDVAGAPAQTYRLVKKNHTVVVIGAGGKSGILVCAVAREILGTTGKLIGVEPGAGSRERLKNLGYCDHILDTDATNPVAVYEQIRHLTQANMADLVINVANVQNTEMSCILSCKKDGICYFFSMATSFTKAALGAEGVASDATLIIGNGYAPDHDRIALDTIRKNPPLKKLFETVYVQG